MSSPFEQLSVFFREFVQTLKFQISSSTQEFQIDIERPPRENREQHYGYRITQDFILAFENEIKKFIDPADFYDPMCASLTRNWLLKELRLRQLDYKCCVDPILEPEDSADEDSEGDREELADEKEDDTKTDEDEGGPTDHEDTEDNTETDEQASSHYENEKDDTETDKEGDTTYYEDEKDDDTKTDEEEPTNYEDEEDDPKTDEGDPTNFEDEKEDDPKTDEDQGDASHYEDEKDDDSKTDKQEAIANNHHEDAKEDEDEGYTSPDDEDETSVFGDADNEFEVEHDAEEVVVVISVCSDDPVSFQARPTQAQMDMMTTLLSQPPQWWLSYRDI